MATGRPMSVNSHELCAAKRPTAGPRARPKFRGAAFGPATLVGRSIHLHWVGDRVDRGGSPCWTRPPRCRARRSSCSTRAACRPRSTGKTPAPRLDTLDGKTVYLVDSRFDDSVELLQADRRPGSPSTCPASRPAAPDGKHLRQGRPARCGTRSRRTATPRSSASAIAAPARRRSPTHAITLETAVRRARRSRCIPTKFVKVVPLGDADGAACRRRRWSSCRSRSWARREAELRAYVDGNDPGHAASRSCRRSSRA